ncbi:conserved hypothetical protein [Gluconacetobacter diazotrophicus PA1 5]|uniref:hypothetical protein n=1 Tax=Gluconacetobacter diazotrophicus TaxID=33996 RepID=UPI000173B210|nr:hypothetical protein [Gluconacetobacter diazotrophicus]ACI51655.1 conserved hypothetical protein [Gluconacetobacter diazotrophicus PA1 5]TWB10999.1 hypothetical protein FBZ86_10122 [Gluconacetobacter diazotrophicus]
MEMFQDMFRRFPLLPVAAGLSVLLAGSAAARPSAAPARPAAAPAAAVSTGQPVSAYDFSPLPVTSGTVAHYLPTPAGDVDGLILTDGTEILCSHELGLAIAGLVKPGDRVSVSGLRGRTLPIVRAYAVDGPRGRRIEDAGAVSVRLPTPTSGPDIVVDGTVRAPLYSLHGQLIGAVMQDHSAIYLTAAEAARLAAWLQPGRPLYAVGNGSTGALGTAIDARDIGPSAGQTMRVAPPDAPMPGAFPGSAAYDEIPGASAHP